MLGDDELADTLERLARLAVYGDLVVFGAVDEAHDVGVLLDSPRLTEVRELRALAIGVTALLAVLYAAVELGEGDDGYVQLLGQHLQ